MHTKRSENNFWYKCSKPNCLSTFQRQHSLNEHMRIHNNEVNYCQYCPYRYVQAGHYKEHLNKHFQINEYKCGECGSTFSTKATLTKHAFIHEGILYCCLICNTYETAGRNTIQSHLRRKHSDLLGRNITWDSVMKHVKMK